MTKILLKGLLKDVYPVITEWDDPSVRTDENGKTVIGRPSLGFGDKGSFTYAGKTLEAQPWSDDMAIIRDMCQAALRDRAETSKKITFLLAGYYPEVKGIPMHSDAVPALNDWVISCSFGGSRVFEWEEYAEDIKTESYTSHTPFLNDVVARDLFLLEHGDVILFNGASQMNSRHSVPDLIGTKPRINLTFRTGL